MATSTRIKALLLTVGFAIVGFLLEGPGPIGQFLWPPAPMPVEPTGAQLAGFMAYTVFESLAFGVGTAFLILGYRRVRAAESSRGLAIAMHLATGWLLVNWVAHDSLHMHFGLDLNGLLALEWGFHGTLIAAGLVCALFLYRQLAAATSTRSPGASTARPMSADRATAGK